MDAAIALGQFMRVICYVQQAGNMNSRCVTEAVLTRMEGSFPPRLPNQGLQKTSVKKKEWQRLMRNAIEHESEHPY